MTSWAAKEHAKWVAEQVASAREAGIQSTLEIMNVAQLVASLFEKIKQQEAAIELALGGIPLALLSTSSQDLDKMVEWQQVTDSNKPLPVPRMVYDESCKRSKITMLRYEVRGTWWRELCSSDYPPRETKK